VNEPNEEPNTLDADEEMRPPNAEVLQALGLPDPATLRLGDARVHAAYAAAVGRLDYYFYRYCILAEPAVAGVEAVSVLSGGGRKLLRRIEQTFEGQRVYASQFTSGPQVEYPHVLSDIDRLRRFIESDEYERFTQGRGVARRVARAMAWWLLAPNMNFHAEVEVWRTTSDWAAVLLWLDWEDDVKNVLPTLLGFAPVSNLHKGVGALLNRHLPGYAGVPDFVEGKGFRPWQLQLLRACWPHPDRGEELGMSLLCATDAELRKVLTR
jgi:hypothetical protein